MDALGDLQMAKKKRSTTSVAKKLNAMKRAAVQARATKKSGALQLGGVRSKARARAAAHKMLTHVDARGRAAMVDVGQKAVTARRAVAEACVMISSELANRIRKNSLAKGNVLDVARLAGIQAAKRTDELIPLCHSLPLDSIQVRAELRRDHIYIWSEAKVTAKTGVEMEALLAVAIAALTVIDMGKSIDRAMTIQGLRMLEKEGGRSGHFMAGAKARR
jgi:cyclic pyranopterin phosphate synthase